MTQSNTEFYVYIHLRKDNGEPFYVGKGSKNRFKDFTLRNHYWKRIYTKYGCLPLIVERSEDEEYILKKELEWYNTLAPHYKLTNLRTCGEKGAKWIYPPSEKHIKNMSTKYTGKGNPFYGKTHTDESRGLIRNAKCVYIYKLTNYYTKEVLIFDSAYDVGVYFNDNKAPNQLRQYAYNKSRYKKQWLVEQIKTNSNDTI